MAYKLDIVDAATLDAETYIAFILEQSNDTVAALIWRDGLYNAVASLQQLPERCPLIAEQHHFRRRLHQLIYQSHRIIFHIRPGLVTIVRIYHASRRPLKSLRTGLAAPAPKTRR